MGEKFFDEYGTLLATVVRRGESQKNDVEFYTSPQEPIQVGRVRYKANYVIPNHYHNPIPRNSTGTMEVLLVISGKIVLNLYSDGYELQHMKTEMGTGDFVILRPGVRHGIRMIDDTVLFECKTGPYTDRNTDKTLF